MNWDLITRNWDLFRGCIGGRWSALTEEDLIFIDGDRERLVARLRERYSLSTREADQAVRRFETPEGAARELWRDRTHIQPHRREITPDGSPR